MIKSIGQWVVVTLGILLVAIQVVPYGHEHTNPPVTQEPPWDAPRTRELAVRACFDCHSNETVWPWYASVAPFSWLVQSDVNEGRRKLNFSEWDRPQRESRDSVKTVRRGRMPPWYYPWAGLSPAERDALVRGLEATLSLSAKKVDD